MRTDLDDLREDRSIFSADLRKYSEAAEVSSSSILQIIARIRERSNARHNKIKERFAWLEHGVAQVHHPPAPPQSQDATTTSQVLVVSSGIVGDRPLGIATIGGNENIITANYLCGMIWELQSKVEVLTKRSKNTGVIF